MLKNVIDRTIITTKNDRGRIWSAQSVTLECGHSLTFEGNDKAVAVDCSRCKQEANNA